MNPIIDHVVVTVLVAVSSLIVVYTLSPKKAQRWVLSKLSRYVGLRVVTWLLPKQCGCEDCPSTGLQQVAKKK